MRWAFLILVLAVSNAHADTKEIVTAHLSWEPGTVGSINSGRMPMYDAPAKDVTPPQGLQNPKYTRIKMAGGKGLAVAFDANESNPRLWIDHDFDDDLSKEKITHLKKTGENWTRRQVVLCRYDDEPESVPVPLFLTHRPAKGSHDVTVYCRIHRRGTVVLGGRLRMIALVDNSFDVCFDDAERDKVYLDLNGDGRFQATGANPAERIHPGKPFRLGEEGWIARVTSKSGRAIEFTRTKDVPPAEPRTWPEYKNPEPGAKRTPPEESLRELKALYEKEKPLAYVGRHPTVTKIGYVGSEDAFKLLLRIAATDKDKALTYAALRALGNPAYLELGGERVLAMARKATKLTAPALAQALYYMGHPERDAVYYDMMASSEGNFVNASARWLAASQTAKARKVILDAVHGHSAPQGRHFAYTNGARYLKGGPPIKTVLAAANDDYALLRAQAIRDLGLLGHPNARKLALEVARERPVNVTVGVALVDVLGAAGDPKAVDAMLAFLEDPKLHGNVRKKVIEQLRFIRSPRSVAVLVKALKAKTPAIRAVAAEILAAIPQRDITAALLRRAKKEKDPDVLPLLLEALGDHGDEVALAHLMKRARSRKKGPARRAAIRALARLGFQHPKVKTFFLALLETKAWEDRILALDAAGATGDKALTPKVLRSLDHKQWQVRLAAVGALDALRCAAAIAPLIGRLVDEEEERVRDAIAETLFRLTGMNLYDNAEIWKQWWAKNGKGFEVPLEVPTLPDEHAGGTQAGFYGIPVRSERIMFVIDQSGSMSAMGKAKDEYEKKELNRLDVAVKEVLGAVAKLKNRARVNVVLFHSTIHPWKDQLQPLGNKNRAALSRHLKSKRPTGGTNLYDGLELALHTKNVDTVFLLSDGVPGVGKYVATPDILRAVRRENQTRRVAIHCVSIGYDSELLRRLASENGGKYVRR